MKTQTIKTLIIAVLMLFAVKAAHSQVVITALPGNAPSYLAKSATNQVVFGFSIFVPAGGTYNPQVFHLATSTGLNGFVSGTVNKTTTNNPALAPGSTPTYGVAINGTLDINGFPSMSGGAGGTTFYYYLVLSITNTANPQPTSVVFSLPAASSISQNNYNGSFSNITVNNSAAASPTYYFKQTAAPTASAVARCGAGSVTITASGSPSGGTYTWYNAASGGTTLQSSTSSSYTANLVTTTTFYVSYQSTTAPESARTPVTATVNPIVSSPYPGAIFSYPFNNNYNDISGNANNGYTTAAPAITNDRYNTTNSAYSFNGSTQFITVNGSGAAVAGPNTFTISIWFNTTTTSGGKLIGYGDAATGLSGSYDRHLYMSNSGQLYFGLYPGAVQTINTAASYNDGNWHHAIVTVGSGGSNIYVDGVSQASSTAMTTGQAYSGRWRIGGDNLSGWTNSPTSNYFAGTLDDIAVYNRVLSASEIASSNDLNQIGFSPSAVCVGSPISFTAPSISGATYTWTDAGGGTQTGQNPTFPAAVSGNYTLSVAGGPGGCSSSATITPTINTPPSTTFTVTSPINTGGSSTITYTGTDPASSTWSWTFTGGSPATGTGKGPFTITYATAGTYTATLSITNAAGCTATASQTINVTTPLPAISYSPAANTYTPGTAIATLTPTSSNVGTAGSFAAGTAFGSGYSAPQDITFDPSGNFYVTSSGNNTISKYNSSGTYVSTFGTGLANPYNMSFDASGNAYITNYGTNSLIKITSAGVQSTLISGLNQPFGNTVDASGNIYIANYGTNVIQKYNSSGGNILSISVNGAVDVATDAAGNIYALSYNNGSITKYNASGTLLSTITTGASNPFGITVDISGNIYVADSGNNRVLEYNSAGTLVGNIATGTATVPRAVAIDASGNVYAALNNTNAVKKYAPAGGYFIDKTLPAGLTFNSSTGAISGTPTTASPATVYTVTAYNSYGSASATETITVNQPAPVITYPTPLYYNVGTTISPVIPTNTGGAVGAYGAASVYKNINNSNGVALDAAGNLYVTSVSGNNVTIYNSAGTLITTKGGYNQPAGIIIDAAGNSYVANRGASNIIKTTPAGVQSVITGGFSQPVGLTMDAAGNIYVADYGNSTIFKISSGASTATSYITGITQPWGIAVNSTGDLYISSLSTNSIYKVPNGSTTPTAFVTSGLTSPRNMYIDASGNIYEADAGTGNVNFISPAGIVTNLLSSLDSPIGIALDASGNIFASGYNFGEVYKSTASGYAIGSTLPAGLNFNKYTGVISGTPTATSPATNYNITATNVSGSSNATTNITVGTGGLGNYAYMRTITLNNAAVGITSNLSNFPVLLSIQNNDLIINGACADKVQNPNGPNYDFAFMDASSASELNYQIESYNQTTGTLLVWVKVPTVYYASNNTISFYYGSKNPSTTHNAAFFQNTWPGDYQSVYHFADAAYSGTTPDGTANGRTATLVGFQTSDLQTGKIGNAYAFGGASGSASANDMEAAASPVTSAFTLSAWVNSTNTNLDEKIMTNQNSGGEGSTGYKLGVYFTIPETEGGNNNGDRAFGPNPTALVNGTWYYIQGVYTGSLMTTYVNGVPYKQAAVTGNVNLTNTLYIGIGEGKNYPFSGLIDEPRVSNIAKTSDWIKMEYVDQNNPVAFTNVSSTAVINSTNASAIGGEVTYTWTGATSTDPSIAGNWSNTSSGAASVLPAFDGSATLVIPAGLTNYPSLTADIGLYGITIASGALLNLNGHTMSVGCNIYNNATTATTGILYGSNNASGITWNGALANQYLYGVTTSPVATGAMTINNSAAGNVTISGGPVNIYSSLTMTKGNLVVLASPAALTLKSTATQTCNVAAIPSGSSITGNVTVERFVTGGTTYNAGRWIYRNYRLMASPVNEGVDGSGNYPYSLNYLAASTIVTGCTSSLGTTAGNPSLYLYKEAYTPNNKTFISGNFIGVTNISGVTASGTISTTDATNATGKMYAGTGYMMYFRGDNINNLAGSPSKTKYPYVAPESVVFSTTGALNQGTYAVTSWTGTTGLLYTVATGNTAVRGFNLVGNPYASTIDWSTFSNVAANSSTAPIYGANVNPSIYILNPITNNYDTYSATTNTSTGIASKYIPSGQGFFVQANAASPTLVFREAAKSNQQVTGSSLLLGTPTKQAAYASLMRMKMIVDSLNYDDMVVGFNETSTASFNSNEDAAFLSGTASLESISSITADSVKASVKWLPFPKTGSRIVRLNVTAKANGTYTLKRTDLKEVPALYEIWLMDKFKKDSLDLKANDTYRFDLDLSDTNSFGSNRFSLVIRQNQALAVHLLNFTATKATGGAQTTWKTENEANYTNFTVERSTDNGATYNVIGGLSSTDAGTYSFLDPNPPVSLDTYRLRMEDVNGAITYSKPIALMYSNSSNSLVSSRISLYPNPVVNTINVNITPAATVTTTPILGTSKAAGALSSSLSSSALAGSPSSISTTKITNPNATYSIKIVSTTGTLIKNITTTALAWQSDVSGIVPGTYIIQVIDNSTKIVIGKNTFVKL